MNSRFKILKCYFAYRNAIYLITIGMATIMSLSCNGKEEQIYYNLKGQPYPLGVNVIDLKALNECTLPICDPNRLDRLLLTKVPAFIISDSTLEVPFTFDSYLLFESCNLDLSGYELGSKVSISGIAKDGCGYLNNPYPFEENYYINITKIEML